MTTPITTSAPPATYGAPPPTPKRTAAELVAAAELGDAVASLLRSDDVRGGPRELLALLMAKEQFAEATRFLAHALPRRACARPSMRRSAGSFSRRTTIGARRWSTAKPRTSVRPPAARRSRRSSP